MLFPDETLRWRTFPNVCLYLQAHAMKRALSVIHLIATEKCGHFSKRFLTLSLRTHMLSNSNMRIIIYRLWSG